MRVTRYLALGDSFTEGMCDDVDTAGRYRGWADRVAVALAAEVPGLTYANHADRGKLLDQVVVEQLPLALDQLVDPDTTLVSFHAGANDVLRPRVDLDGVLARYDRAVGLVARRTADHYDALVQDNGRVPVLQDRRLWADDRLHLAPDGHRRVAAGVLELLGVDDPRLLGGAPGAGGVQRRRPGRQAPVPDPRGAWPCQRRWGMVTRLTD